MTRVAWWSAGTLALVAVACAGWWLDSYRWAGGFRTVEPHFNGTCTPVAGVPSPEDLQIDHATGVAYVSSYDRVAIRRGESIPGAILAYDLSHPSARPANLTPDAGPDFRPHGLSLFSTEGAASRLFVINHADGERVEIFDVTAAGLRHARTVRGGALVSPNDLVAVGPDRFYVTNSRKYTRGAPAWIESTFRMSWGNVVYFDGSSFTEVVGRIGFPNGINRDPGNTRVYIVSSFDQAVYVYERDPATGTLTPREHVAVGTRLDNVDVAADGELWVAGRAQYLDAPQPSQVVRISRDGTVEEVYVSRGEQFGNASVAAVYKKDLLIGSSAGDRFLHCVTNE